MKSVWVVQCVCLLSALGLHTCNNHTKIFFLSWFLGLNSGPQAYTGSSILLSHFPSLWTFYLLEIFTGLANVQKWLYQLHSWWPASVTNEHCVNIFYLFDAFSIFQKYPWIHSLSETHLGGDYQPCFKDEAMVAQVSELDGKTCRQEPFSLLSLLYYFIFLQEIEMHRCCRDVAFTRP